MSLLFLLCCSARIFAPIEKVCGIRMIENRHMRRVAARERFYAVAARRAGISQVLLALLALLALTFQALVVQTHVHNPQAAGLTAGVSVATLVNVLADDAVPTAAETKAKAPGDKSPINDDSSNCPMCQQIAHSGQFVQSAAVLAVLPRSIAVSFIPWTQAAVSLLAVTHNWKSRAPPVAP